VFFLFRFRVVRIALPIVSTVTVPTPQLESYILNSCLWADGTRSRAQLTAQPQLIPSIARCSRCTVRQAVRPSRARVSALRGDGCAARRSVSQSSADHEQVQTARVDYNVDSANMAWFVSRPTPEFRRLIPIRLIRCSTRYRRTASILRGGIYTLFSSRLVNYFNPAFSWYESLFGPDDLQKTLEAFPIVLQGTGGSAPFSTLGGLDTYLDSGATRIAFFR